MEVCKRRGLRVNAGKSKVMILNGEEGLECEVCRPDSFRACLRIYKNFDVFWTNQLQTRPSALGRWRVGGGLQMPLGPQLMIGICILNGLESCMKQCLYLFLCMAVRKCYGRRRRDLELGLYKLGFECY